MINLSIDFHLYLSIRVSRRSCLHHHSTPQALLRCSNSVLTGLESSAVLYAQSSVLYAQKHTLALVEKALAVPANSRMGANWIRPDLLAP